MNLYWNSSLSNRVYQEHPRAALFHTYVVQKYPQYASIQNKQQTQHNTFIYKKSKSQSHHGSIPAGSPGLIPVCKTLQNSLPRAAAAAALANAIHHFKWIIMVMFSKHNIMMPQSLQLQHCLHQLRQDTEHYLLFLLGLNVSFVLKWR